jgi:hypothetical protein
VEQGRTFFTSSGILFQRKRALFLAGGEGGADGSGEAQPQKKRKGAHSFAEASQVVFDEVGDKEHLVH